MLVYHIKNFKMVNVQLNVILEKYTIKIHLLVIKQDKNKKNNKQRENNIINLQSNNVINFNIKIRNNVYKNVTYIFKMNHKNV